MTDIGEGDGRPITRRGFLRSTGAAALALAAPRSVTRLGRRSSRTSRSVAIFGGGVAGLTAAHELAERGFDVTIYERRAWGGKARSTMMPRSAADERLPLPGEHGYRVEFGFYKNLPDTMRRIPFGSNPNGVFDNLVAVPQIVWGRAGGRDITLPVDTQRLAHTPAQVLETLEGLLIETELPPDAVTQFAARMAVYMSSCDDRRTGQWGHTSWLQFIGADRYSDDYRKLLAETFSQLIVASKEEHTSARFSGRVVELFLYTLLGRGADGSVMRILDAPTNEAWIDPWIEYLRQAGVRLRKGYGVVKLAMRDGQISGALVHGPHGMERIRADWYIVALPAERARRLWSKSILAADPGLERMEGLKFGWLSGLQLYVKQPTPLARGHYICVDSPWLVSSISQAQFWNSDFAQTYGDGGAHDCISAIVSDWNQPGVLYGKPARYCTAEEVALEVWEQMKRHMNDTGEARLTDDMLHSWFIDPGLVWREDRWHNEDPLILPTVGSGPYRPDVTTGIPNLFLTGDYLDGEGLVANMEAPNINSRRAVNSLLEVSGSKESPVQVIPLYRPPEWEAAKAIDEERYKRGKPNLLDVPEQQGVDDLNLLDQLGLGSLRSSLPVRV